MRDHVVTRLSRDQKLRRRFFQEGERAERNTNEPVYRHLEVSRYLYADKRFLQLLAILTVMTGGLPPRRKELLGICWCNREAPRNLYLHAGLLVLLTNYHKGQWRVGSRPCARALPVCVGEPLIHYLIYVTPVLGLFSHCMRYPVPSGALFREDQGTWAPEQLSAAIKLHTQRLLGDSIKVSQWRHIAIALDRRLLQGIACQVYNVNPDAQTAPDEDGSDSDQDDYSYTTRTRSQRTLTASGVHSLQAAHTLETGVTHYGNSQYPFARMTDVLLADFIEVSRQWHQLWQLPSLQPVARSRRKRGVSNTAEQAAEPKRAMISGRLHTRRQRWTWPTLQQGLRKLFGPKADVRDSTQKAALTLFASSRPEIAIVMPTGAGKSVLFMALSVIPSAEVTIVIMPLVALRQDLVRRCRE